MRLTANRVNLICFLFTQNIIVLVFDIEIFITELELINDCNLFAKNKNFKSLKLFLKKRLFCSIISY